MQTFNFQCGHCGKLIAVEVSHLNQQVRCPFCLQVVLAERSPSEQPAAPPTDSGPDAVSVPLAAVPEAPPGESATSAPPTETPVEPPAVEPHIEVPLPVIALAIEPPFPESLQPAAETVPELPSAVRRKSSDPVPVPAGEPPVLSLDDAPSSPPSPEQPIAASPWPHEPVNETPFAPDPSAPVASLPPERRPAPARSGVSIWIVLPLVSYSILATCLLVVMWNRLQTIEDHPLVAFLPDAEGDAPGVVRKPKAVSEAGKRKLIGQPLPEGLKVRLGQTRTVGALAVTPQRVTRERVGVAPGSTLPEKLEGASLVLHLRLENISEDETFQPLDRYFDRKWRDGSSPGAPPLTLLEAGPGRRFFGGPAVWRPRRASARDNDAAPEFIYLMTGDKPVGNPVDRPLGPGESEEVFVCTDGDDPRADELSRYRGELLWRVHLRRGLVRVRGRDGREREVSAAAVVGVVFSGKDVGG